MRSTHAWAADGSTATPSTALHRTLVERRDLRADDIAVRVDYCGVCHSDLHALHEHGAGGGDDSEGPLVPGHEFTGVVTEIGPAGAQVPGRGCRRRRQHRRRVPGLRHVHGGPGELLPGVPHAHLRGSGSPRRDADPRRLRARVRRARGLRPSPAEGAGPGGRRPAAVRGDHRVGTAAGARRRARGARRRGGPGRARASRGEAGRGARRRDHRHQPFRGQVRGRAAARSCRSPGLRRPAGDGLVAGAVRRHPRHRGRRPRPRTVPRPARTRRRPGAGRATSAPSPSRPRIC